MSNDKGNNSSARFRQELVRAVVQARMTRAAGRVPPSAAVLAAAGGAAALAAGVIQQAKSDPDALAGHVTRFQEHHNTTTPQQAQPTEQPTRVKVESRFGHFSTPEDMRDNPNKEVQQLAPSEAVMSWTAKRDVPLGIYARLEMASSASPSAPKPPMQQAEPKREEVATAKSRFWGNGTDFESTPFDMRKLDEQDTNLPELTPDQRRGVVAAVSLTGSGPAAVFGYSCAAGTAALAKERYNPWEAFKKICANPKSSFLAPLGPLTARLMAANTRNIPVAAGLDKVIFDFSQKHNTPQWFAPLALATVITLAETSTTAPLEFREIQAYLKALSNVAQRGDQATFLRFLEVSFIKNMGPSLGTATTLLRHLEDKELQKRTPEHDPDALPGKMGKGFRDGFVGTFPVALATQRWLYDAANGNTLFEIGVQAFRNFQPNELATTVAVAVHKSTAVGSIVAVMAGALHLFDSPSSSVKKPLDRTEEESTLAEPLPQVNECRAESVKLRVRTGPYG